MLTRRFVLARIAGDLEREGLHHRSQLSTSVHPRLSTLALREPDHGCSALQSSRSLAPLYANNDCVWRLCAGTPQRSLHVGQQGHCASDKASGPPCALLRPATRSPGDGGLEQFFVDAVALRPLERGTLDEDRTAHGPQRG